MTIKEWFKKVFYTKKPIIPQKPKVFCNECFYHLHTNGTGTISKDGIYHLFRGLDVCAEPSKLEITKEPDTAIKKGSGKITHIWYDRCEKFNSKNNCPLFRPKEEKKEDEKPSGTS